MPSGPNVGPAVLHDSGPTPASIARGSRASTTESIEKRVLRAGRSFALRRVTGMLLGRPLPGGPSPPFGSTVGEAFIFVKESVRDRFPAGGGGGQIREAALGKRSPLGDEGRPGDEVDACHRRRRLAVSSRGQPMIASRLPSPQPPEARAIAVIEAARHRGGHATRGARTRCAEGQGWDEEKTSPFESIRDRQVATCR